MLKRYLNPHLGEEKIVNLKKQVLERGNVLRFVHRSSLGEGLGEESQNKSV